ncbi:MAG TPA: electron transfer flavoprotein subunit alpha/FixB family protein, partial [Bryobacteraceae bacterium]
MNGVLVVLEQRPRGGRPVWSRSSWEALAAGQELAAQINHPVVAAVAGDELDELNADLSRQQILGAYTVKHELLAAYTADGFCAALRQLIGKLDPEYVFFPHTYQVRDFAPRLAAMFGQ